MSFSLQGCEEMRSGGSIDGGGEPEDVSTELTAPSGWRKMFILKKGGAAKKNKIVFIAPTGKEITSKKQLQQYLKSQTGGPALREFDWSMNGEGLRRSARIREKAKSVVPPESQPEKKRARRSSSGPKKDDEETEPAPQKSNEIEEIGEESRSVTCTGESAKLVDDGVDVKKANMDSNAIEGAIIVQSINSLAVEINEGNKESDNSTEETQPANLVQNDTKDDQAKHEENQTIVSERTDFELEKGKITKTTESVTSDEKVGEGEQKASQPPTCSAGEENPSGIENGDNVREEAEPNSQNFKQPAGIDSQQHLPPALSC